MPSKTKTGREVLQHPTTHEAATSHSEQCADYADLNANSITTGQTIFSDEYISAPKQANAHPELETCRGIRSDVRRNCVIVSACALTRTWPAGHYAKRDRSTWNQEAAAAFRLSGRELAELTGMSHQSARTALKTLLATGFIVELAPMRARGNDRGSTPPTYALKCHIRHTTKSDSMGSDSMGSGTADQPQPVQAWDL